MGKVSAELGQRVYLDANIIIYAVEGFALYLDIAWLKDESNGAKDKIDDPATLAQEAVTELTACLKELTGIFAELGEKADLDELREFLNQIEANEGAIVESV